jgi:mRNA interferase RelE/StbE
MNVTYDRKFFKDFSAVPEYVQVSFAELRKEFEKISTIREIPNCRPLKGNKDFFRIRLGDYRVTLKLNDANSMELKRFLPRGQVYKKHTK